MKRQNPKSSSFERGKLYYQRQKSATDNRTEAPDKDTHIALKFFLFFEYAHPNYKDKNPFKQEFIEFVNLMDYPDEARANCIYRLFNGYKKRYNKPIKPEWTQNKPAEINAETFKEL